jgi:hypothetical protein
MNQTADLQGDALHAFLDQAHELLHDEDDEQPSAISREDRVAAAVELMEQQSFAPATAYELERLHDFWLLLESPGTANALLQQHRARVLQPEANPPADAALRLALSDIQSRTGLDRAAATELLLPAAQAISRLPEDIDPDGYWNGWQWMARELQAWDLAARGLDMHRAQQRANPDLTEDDAYLDAMVCLKKAELAQNGDDAAHVSAMVQAAVNTLRDAAPDQDVDFERWMALAARALPLAPQSLPSLLMACEQRLTRTEVPAPSQAVKMHRKVRIVRLQAQACALAGQLEAALQLGNQGRFGLVHDEGDSFSAVQLDWLVQAGRFDEAAALALESVLHARPVSSVSACKLAQQRYESDPERAVTWALVLACARLDDDMSYLLAEEEMPPQPADYYLDLVRAVRPSHPVLALLEGMRLAQERQMDKALPLLEQSVGQHPEFADSAKLPALWAARFAALPLEEALARPIPEAHGGHWCYGAGVALDDADDLAILMGHKKKVPADELREPLVLHYYEEGLRRFEHFWATGQGRFKDADLHVYSMLCNNLGIKYRFLERYDEATELHRKGLSSSPFAEHQDGLLWCAIGKDDDAQIVAEAERLWHFVLHHGYGRHEPASYFSIVAMSLYKLDRDTEISIWLERLDQWFGELSAEEQRDDRRNYLAALMSMLDFFSATQPELVLPRLRAHQQEVRELKECYALRRLGCALEAYPELLEESVAMHKEAASRLCKHDNEDERRMAHDGLARAERKLAERDASATTSGRKPWWKFW